MDDRGGTLMTVDRLYRNLLNKLINANIDLDAYLQLRKAKGYMSVSENEHLRDNLFELCRELREGAPRLQHAVTPEEREALRLAGEAVASAAVCLMSGHHDCPSYIAVNVETLERCLAGLSLNIHKLNASAPTSRV
jgi:biofilm regulator BssR